MIFDNFITKKQSKYRTALKKLEEDTISNIHFTLKREYSNLEGLKINKEFNILDNHLMVISKIEGEKEPYIKYMFYGHLGTPHFQKNTLFERLGSKYKWLVIPFGNSLFDIIRISYERESDVQDFLKELKKRYYDYLKRFLEMQK